MKKAYFCLLLVVCIFLITGCSTATYKNAESLRTFFLENEAAFDTAAKALEKVNGLWENGGYIHEPSSTAQTDICTLDPNSIWVEIDHLHINSENALFSEEYTIIAKTVNELLTEVNITSISFSHNHLKFILYDVANQYAWYPTIVYCFDTTMDRDDLQRYIGSDEIIQLKEQWYACIVAH